MARYIDMEKYIEQGWILTLRNKNSIRVLNLSELKTEEGIAQKTGYWIEDSNGLGAECSNCGADAVYKIIKNTLEYESYCAHCGSKNTKGVKK